MPEDAAIRELAFEVVAQLTAAGKTLATAESCTGGWIAKALTDVPGSSACFGYGIVSYSNEAKELVLGVRRELLTTEGAVSETTVREMAEGVLELSSADIAVAVSGIAGPDGGTADKPVGTVWFAWCMRRGDGLGTETERRHYRGSRDEIRRDTVIAALRGVCARLAS